MTESKTAPAAADGATTAAPAAPVRKAAAKKVTAKKATVKAATAKKAPVKKAAAKDVAPKKATATPKVVAAPAPAKLKHKLVRDSFTIPKSEYLVLQGLKERAADLKRPTKKSELLRAGIAALQAMPDKAFLAALAAVPALKTGRPKGEDAAAKDSAGK